MSNTLKTRFAPSPTGLLHLGNVRTALFSYLFAHHASGRFLLRIEDTDATRSRAEFTQALIEDLRWLGLEWDEGPGAGGEGPFEQSARGAVYEEHYRRLAEQGLTYPCFCTREELALARKARLAAGQPPRYSGKCARLDPAEAQARLARGERAALRFRVPAAREVVFTDRVRGEQRFASEHIGDFIIRRDDGAPAFFFTNALDDALMGVTHVLRGEDHLTNTPRQILLLDALDLPVPEYAHIAMIVSGDGSPLSKRGGSLSLRALREAGFLPGALTNHLARLGHYYGHDEWLELPALAAAFDPDRLSRSPAVHDEARLLFWQKAAVTHASPETLLAWAGPRVLERVPEAERPAFLNAVRDNVRLPAELADWAERVYGEPAPEADAVAAMRAAGAEFYRAALAALAEHGTDFAALGASVRQRTGARGKALFMPLRAALSGRLHGPEMARLFPLIGVERAQRRLTAASEE